MALANTYAEWIALVRDWLDIDDLSDAQIRTCLSLAQIRMNREMESYEQEKTYTYIQRDPAKVSRHLSDFDSDWFTLIGATIIDTPVSPNIPSIFPSKYSNAWSLIEDTSTGFHEHYDTNDYSQSIPVGSVITASYLVKVQSGTRGIGLDIACDDFASGGYIQITSAGTIITDNVYGGAVLVADGVEDLGGGWFRLWLSVSGLPSPYLQIGLVLLSGSNTQYAGDGVSGWLIQHHEIELQPLSSVDNYSIPTPFNILEYIADFNKIRLVVPGQNELPMDVVPINEFTRLVSEGIQTGVQSGPQAYGFYNIDANMMNMLPMPAKGAYPTIYYYFTVEPISDTVPSNVFTEYYSDALLWAACVEASMFIVEDERAGTYENKYLAALETANNKPKRVKMGSTPLRRQVSVYGSN